MKKPETNSSDNKASPGKDGKKKAVSGSVIDSRPVSAGEGAPAAKSEPKPQIESRLVGSGAGSDAAAPKPASAKPVTESKSDASQPVAGAKPGTVPPVAKADSGPAEAPKPAPSQSQPAKVETRVVEVRKAGFAPTFLGGVVAAGLGAAAAWWAIPHLPPAWQPGVADPAPTEAQIAAAREAAVEAAREEIQAQADAFANRASEAGADAARQALADTAPQGGDAEALRAQEEKLAALEKTVADLAARPVVAPVVSGEDSEGLQQVLNELTGRLAAQQSRIDELAARPAADTAGAEQVQDLAAQAEALQARIAAAAEEAEKRIAAAEAQASELQQSAEAANRRAQAATAAAALQAAIETGGARDQALADLRAAGIEPPAVLAGDVPTLAQLRAGFPAAAREGLAAALKDAPENEGALGAISSFLRVQTGARSVEPREGSDPDAVLSRADAAVSAGDIKGALAEIAALPQSGQAAMADWTARAQTWVEANAALATLAAGSM
ncbi:hypothetical protein [Paracoccus denitrificans]|uniref:hypothetical protein n=1 Tax=Paracoccus denitrificans TaxID=266 RepID=UPI00030AA87C|nr:hypothetical protein [Paracoccus denitrificans]MBB4628805.1 hypothetical protein [Paracoccus denitrificans]MCU7429812.1 hypothetical protein [Paracoccus denitrificans]QAR25464.1 hypothetical protein EO213_03640 [Paracoccus denitrificans]GEK69013.1 hypothetical protein PDE01_25330 [Paracoccus denitrificans]